MSPNRVRIPDLTARPDEIGRLSGALRGMVAALYDRIEANEQFAADVAHEIKNPLASLRSAVGTLRVARRDDQREKLLDVIDHDVRRLDRLISDISNASRLDSELVRETEAPFDLLKMLSNISQHFSQESAERGVEFITDLPSKPIVVHGLEARLAQVFVNLISNAVSFCEAGDAVRVWARRRENRVLVVVEDTGPGIPEQAIQKIFNRFYSERPAGQFGNHSGLGLAISKQIVEAHGGVIWAENIRPTNADLMSEPLGARFVVGLPV
jgi:two-component system sensor histidine kinase ChvG